MIAEPCLPVDAGWECHTLFQREQINTVLMLREDGVKQGHLYSAGALCNIYTLLANCLRYSAHISENTLNALKAFQWDVSSEEGVGSEKLCFLPLLLRLVNVGLGIYVLSVRSVL